MLYFCTLFDSNYLTRGLSMHESLESKCKDYHLYIFPFDNKCYDILTGMNLNNVTIVKFDEFEDPELLNIKPSRSNVEYCWTCTPSIILYSIKKFNLPHCTYLDADLYFYSSPEALVQELGDRSVLITEHRYTSKYDQTKVSGIYCVQFVTFKNDDAGLKVLKWWRDACLDWCYAKPEDGKFGDQKYLDDWPKRFKGIYVLQNFGGGIAPWNVQQYTIYKSNDTIYLKDNLNSKIEKLVFYHFHGVRFFKNGDVDLNSNYFIPDKVKDLLYKGYIKKLNKNKNIISKIDNTFDPNGSVRLNKNLRTYWLFLQYKLKHTYNFIFSEDFTT